MKAIARFLVLAALCLISGGQGLVAQPTLVYNWTTLAGWPGYGSVDGTGGNARFHDPAGVAVDSVGNLYVADSSNNTIRKVTPAGVVSTLVGLAGSPGSADGTGANARFSGPHGVAVDSAGNVYVADTGNQTIRKVTSAAVVSTLVGLTGSSGSADGTGANARFGGPGGVAVDSAGNVYVADTGNQTIRKGILLSAGTPPTITLQPSGQTNSVGTVASFTVSAVGFGPLGYQWRHQGTNLLEGGQVFGATTPTLSLLGVGPLNAGSYTVVVSNSAGSVTSAVATLTILTTPQPLSLQVLSGFEASGLGPSNPFAGLIQAGNGLFYGTAASGGDSGYGTVFQVTSNGVVTTLVSFAYTNGANPNAGLLLDSDGNFDGTTYGGGVNFAGTMFRVTPGGLLTTLAAFNQATGVAPTAALIKGADGSFYGTAHLGGPAAWAQCFG